MQNTATRLGLERAIGRLIAEDGFHSTEDALDGIAEYEAFFFAALGQTESVRVSSDRIDRIWQRHILDTKAYERDCLSWGNGYLHRFVSSQGLPKACKQLELPSRRNIADQRSDLNWLIPAVRRVVAARSLSLHWVRDALHLLENNPAVLIDEYLQFLQLMTVSNGQVRIPCKLVDEVWHQHILATNEYAAYCRALAGRFLHHQPHYEEPHEYHRQGFRATQQEMVKLQNRSLEPRLWNHLGESGGCSSDDDPTYNEVRSRQLSYRLKPRFGYAEYAYWLHPVLAIKGVTLESWQMHLERLRQMPIVPGYLKKVLHFSLVSSLFLGLLALVFTLLFNGNPGFAPLVALFYFVLIYAIGRFFRPISKPALADWLQRIQHEWQPLGIAIRIHKDPWTQVVIEAADESSLITVTERALAEWKLRTPPKPKRSTPAKRYLRVQWDQRFANEFSVVPVKEYPGVKEIVYPINADIELLITKHDVPQLLGAVIDYDGKDFAVSFPK